MDPINIERWLQIFTIAEQIGTNVLAEIMHASHKVMTKEENEQVLAVWNDNRNRARHNAGLDIDGE